MILNTTLIKTILTTYNDVLKVKGKSEKEYGTQVSS